MPGSVAGIVRLEIAVCGDGGSSTCQATPPGIYATAFSYDADGDTLTQTAVHGGTWVSNSAPTLPTTQGITYKFYDADDRLVEVEQPYDPSSDTYTNPHLATGGPAMGGPWQVRQFAVTWNRDHQSVNIKFQASCGVPGCQRAPPIQGDLICFKRRELRYLARYADLPIVWVFCEGAYGNGPNPQTIYQYTENPESFFGPLWLTKGLDKSISGGSNGPNFASLTEAIGNL